MIVFSNQSEIDPRSISAFGVSVKDGSNPIGFFGTGLKYAIAVLLRTGHEVTVLSGLSVIRFGVDRQAVRGKEFDFVTMAIGDEAPAAIGFTTELGKQWQVWMAYRELACNCKDEQGTAEQVVSAPEPAEGVTHIIVTGAEFAECYQNRHSVILEDEAQRIVGETEVRDREGFAFYYRGVRVHNFGRQALHTYNSNGHLELTEDRTLKHQYMADCTVRNAIMRSTDQAFIRRCVLAEDDTLEGGLDFHGYGVAPSKEFLSVIGECAQDRVTKVNATALKVWREATHQKFEPREIGLTKVQLVSLNRALDFCEKLGFAIRGAYPIKVVESMGDGCLGMAQDKTIFIAERVFHLGGTKQLASTLIEEYLHLRHGYLDMSRELQSFLFEKLVSVGEELVGEPL